MRESSYRGGSHLSTVRRAAPTLRAARTRARFARAHACGVTRPVRPLGLLGIGALVAGANLIALLFLGAGSDRTRGILVLSGAVAVPVSDLSLERLFRLTHRFVRAPGLSSRLLLDTRPHRTRGLLGLTDPIAILASDRHLRGAFRTAGRKRFAGAVLRAIARPYPIGA